MNNEEIKLLILKVLAAHGGEMDQEKLEIEVAELYSIWLQAKIHISMFNVGLTEPNVGILLKDGKVELIKLGSENDI